MDPDCALCHAPAHAACDCEAKGLDVAIKQAEDRMMRSIYTEIRKWVRGHAQDYILEYFRLLADQRKTQHSNELDAMKAHAYANYHAPPHPLQIAEAQDRLKQGIDDDWQASVQRYPEVLAYFFGLVELTLPPNDDASVIDPPLTPPSVHQKPTRRVANGHNSHYETVQAITAPPYPRQHIPSRISPPIEARRERRMPAPVRERRPNARHSYQPPTAPYQYAPFGP